MSIQQEEKSRKKKNNKKAWNEFLSCSVMGNFVCIPQAAALSLLSEPRWEKGQNPAEMKECEALVQPPLAFTPGKKTPNHSRASHKELC